MTNISVTALLAMFVMAQVSGSNAADGTVEVRGTAGYVSKSKVNQRREQNLPTPYHKGEGHTAEQSHILAETAPQGKTAHKHNSEEEYITRTPHGQIYSVDQRNKAVEKVPQGKTAHSHPKGRGYTVGKPLTKKHLSDETTPQGKTAHKHNE